MVACQRSPCMPRCLGSGRSVKFPASSFHLCVRADTWRLHQGVNIELLPSCFARMTSTVFGEAEIVTEHVAQLMLIHGGERTHCQTVAPPGRKERTDADRRALHSKYQRMQRLQHAGGSGLSRRLAQTGRGRAHVEQHGLDGFSLHWRHGIRRHSCGRVIGMPRAKVTTPCCGLWSFACRHLPRGMRFTQRRSQIV
jgi:hypothetical protein